MPDLWASLNAASAAGALRRVSFRPDAANDFMHSSCLRELVESGRVSNEQVGSLVLARTRSFYTYPSEATVTIPVTTVPLPRTHRTRLEHQVGSRARDEATHTPGPYQNPPTRNIFLESLLGSSFRPQANTSVFGHRPRFCSMHKEHLVVMSDLYFL